jgi:hypothetical protein
VRLYGPVTAMTPHRGSFVIPEGVPEPVDERLEVEDRQVGGRDRVAAQQARVQRPIVIGCRSRTSPW